MMHGKHPTKEEKMKCKNCSNDLGYKAGMHWPPYKATCKLGRKPMVNTKNELYNRKCKKEESNE